jgi:S1-C subfamily serine protease
VQCKAACKVQSCRNLKNDEMLQFKKKMLQGDSGGALLNPKGKQVGIVSWAVGCARPSRFITLLYRQR